jgi:hypothetical protein
MNIRESITYALIQLVSTRKISEETKKALLKIGAEHTLKDGKERTLEDIVKLLIEERKPRQKYILI